MLRLLSWKTPSAEFVGRRYRLRNLDAFEKIGATECFEYNGFIRPSLPFIE
jgi:hypothetical protein